MDKFKELNLKIEKPKNKRIINHELSENKKEILKINEISKCEHLLKFILSIVENIEYLINNNYIDNDEYQNRLKQLETLYHEIKKQNNKNSKLSIKDTKDKINEIKKILKSVSLI